MPLDINEVVNEVITLLQHELSSQKMSLRMELAPAWAWSSRPDSAATGHPQSRNQRY